MLTPAVSNYTEPLHALKYLRSELLNLFGMRNILTSAFYLS